jgi:cell wall-associated NlpC family hydrolase
VTVQAPSPSSTGDPSTNSVTTVAPPSQYGGVVGVAMGQLGKAYVWGSEGPDTFDCSGLVVYAYGAMGVSLPHSSYSLWNVGVYVSRDQLQPRRHRLLRRARPRRHLHRGRSVHHAPHTGDVVKISSLNEGWYAATYVGARGSSSPRRTARRSGARSAARPRAGGA